MSEEIVVQQLKAFTEELDHDALPPCVYCRAPWLVFSLDPSHGDGCPMVTGVYPVREEDLQDDGFVCEKCNKPFVLGGFYKSVLQSGTDDTYVVVCLPCLNS